MANENRITDSLKEESVSLFDKLYSAWHHVYGNDKTIAEIKEKLPGFPELPHLDSISQVARSVAKFEAAAVRYREITYPNAEAIINQLRAEFESSEAKKDFIKFPIVSEVLNDLYKDTIMDVVYSGYLTMSGAIENTIRQIKLVLDIPEKGNNDPILMRFGIDFQRLMNKERAMKNWNEVTSSRIFAINTIANRIKHEFAIIRQEDVLLNYLPNIASGNHINIDKKRFFFDLKYTSSYVYLLLNLVRDIKFNNELEAVAKEQGTQNSSIFPSPEQNIMTTFRTLLDLDNILGEEHKLPNLTELACYSAQ